MALRRLTGPRVRGWARLTDPRSAGLGITVAALAGAPLVLLGYGTDIDVGNALRSGSRWLDQRTYVPSRPPGAPVFEVAVAALDRLGGSVAIASVSLGFGLLALWALGAILRDEGWARAGWAPVLLALNPWFLVAATSLAEPVWSLGLGLSGAVTARRGHRVAAGVLFGLAIGCRGSTALLVLAWLVAERTGEERSRVEVRDSVVTAAVVLMVGALCFVPPWWAAGRSLAFLDAPIEYLGFGSHLGRWTVKNLAVAGPLSALVLAAALRPLAGVARQWGSSLSVRFALLAVAVTEVLFLRFPLKPVHLLPVVAATAIIVARSGRARLVVALVVTQLVGAGVGISLASPDVPDRATGGSIEVRFVDGPLLNDVRCRLEDRRRGPWPSATDLAGAAAALGRSEANFDCQGRSWKGRSG